VIQTSWAAERIDIVTWSPDPERFATLAMGAGQCRARLQRPRHQDPSRPSWTKTSSAWIGNRNGQETCAARSELTGGKNRPYSSREWIERGGRGGPLRAAAVLQREEETQRGRRLSLARRPGINRPSSSRCPPPANKKLGEIIEIEATRIRASRHGRGDGRPGSAR